MTKTKCEKCGMELECKLVPITPGNPDHGNMILCESCYHSESGHKDLEGYWLTLKPYPEKEKKPSPGKSLSEKPYETRVQKHARILRKHGYNAIALYPTPTAGEPGQYFEVWGRAGNTLILQVWPKEDACCVYVNDGNPTWEEWERSLDL